MQINIGDVIKTGTTLLSGYQAGRDVRNKLNITKLDTDDENVIIIIPDEITAMNISFFIACFGMSVHQLGEKKFRKKYTFQCSVGLKHDIDEGIDRSTKTLFQLPPAPTIPTFDFVTVDLSSREMYRLS